MVRDFYYLFDVLISSTVLNCLIKVLANQNYWHWKVLRLAKLSNPFLKLRNFLSKYVMVQGSKPISVAVYSHY